MTATDCMTNLYPNLYNLSIRYLCKPNERCELGEGLLLAARLSLVCNT
jgi:hypothetical protein